MKESWASFAAMDDEVEDNEGKIINKKVALLKS